MYVTREMAKRIDRYAQEADSNETVYELLTMIRDSILIDDLGNREIVANEQNELESITAAQIAASLAESRRQAEMIAAPMGEVARDAE